MATATHLMTVAEFINLPEPRNGYKQELRAGEVVEFPPPVLKHVVVQNTVMLFLHAAKPSGSYVSMEIPFRALPEHETRAADVAWISAERWKYTNFKGYLFGAPDLVVEVLSPSNTRSEMQERETLCLANGTLEFWVIDADRRQVSVTRKGDSPQLYIAGEQIPLTLLNARPIPVDAVFADLA